MQLVLNWPAPAAGAWTLVPGTLRRLATLKIGDVLLVEPGERVVTDGTLRTGRVGNIAKELRQVYTAATVEAAE